MAGAETKRFTLALGQLRVVGGDVAGNIERAVAMIAEAARGGAGIVVLPEVLDCGWCDESARIHAAAIPDGPAFEALANAAVEHKVHVCAGLTERDEDKFFNAAVLIGPDGELLLKHRKVNELAIAKHLYSTGKTAKAVCDTPFGKVGLLICADAFFVGEALTRSLAGLGAEIILSPCAWAVPPDHDNKATPYGALWRDVYGRPAKEHGLWIAGASNVGTIRHGAWSGHHCIGCSMVVGPDGEVSASGPYGIRSDAIIYTQITP